MNAYYIIKQEGKRAEIDLFRKVTILLLLYKLDRGKRVKNVNLND